jgi:hypothetical protein
LLKKVVEGAEIKGAEVKLVEGAELASKNLLTRNIGRTRNVSSAAKRGIHRRTAQMKMTMMTKSRVPSKQKA